MERRKPPSAHPAIAVSVQTTELTQWYRQTGGQGGRAGGQTCKLTYIQIRQTDTQADRHLGDEALAQLIPSQRGGQTDNQANRQTKGNLRREALLAQFESVTSHGQTGRQTMGLYRRSEEAERFRTRVVVVVKGGGKGKPFTCDVSNLCADHRSRVRGYDNSFYHFRSHFRLRRRSYRSGFAVLFPPYLSRKHITMYSV